MSSELFERCIAEAATVAENVYFHVLGEPTLHPGFGLFLKKLEATPLKLNLTTNGTTIARVSERILECPAMRQVNFSTHAYAELPRETALTHLQDVLDFCKMANAVRPDLYINLRLWNVGDAASRSWNETMLAKVNEAFAGTKDSSSDGTQTAPHISLEHFCSRHKSFPLVGRIYLHQDSRLNGPPRHPRPSGAREGIQAKSRGPVTRLTLTSLFCTMVALSPVAWTIADKLVLDKFRSKVLQKF